MKAILFIIIFMFSYSSYADQIVWSAKLFCEELSAKAFSVNNEIYNLKMDGEGLEVIVEHDFITTRYPSSSTKTRYDSVISLNNKDANGKYILNAQYVAKNGGMFGTKTVTIIYQQSTESLFMISSEPFALGTDYPAIRTNFHKCYRDKD